jgi:hypothetical protein
VDELEVVEELDELAEEESDEDDVVEELELELADSEEAVLERLSLR